jgi:hypothetical protein
MDADREPGEGKDEKKREEDQGVESDRDNRGDNVMAAADSVAVVTGTAVSNAGAIPKGEGGENPPGGGEGGGVGAV